MPAMISTLSTRRGPGRLKKALPSTTQVSARSASKRSRAASTSRRLRSREKPHAITTTTSGSASITCCHRSGCAGWRATPSCSSPPAMGRGSLPLPPWEGRRGWARTPPLLVAARHGDELRCPVTTVKGRVDPFETDHLSRTPSGDTLLDRHDPPAKGIANVLRGIRPSDQAADQENVLEDVLEALRLERHQLGRRPQPAGGPLDHWVGDGADLAQFLRQDQVGVERRQQVGVERVDAASLVDELSNVAIHLRSGARRGEHTSCQHRLGPDRLREIALVRNSHQLVLEAERTDDFGG